MAKKDIYKLFYFIRNLRSRALFLTMKRYCRGKVLDVGGWDFFLVAKKRRFKFEAWTTLDTSISRRPEPTDRRFRFVVGNGCQMPFKKNEFDTVLNIQVLEHVMEPLKMVEEIARVLRPKGVGIFLIPQTSTLHMLPDHYYNFTRFWIQKAFKENRLKIMSLKPLGGFWSSLASHLVYFFFESAKLSGLSGKVFKRNLLFYLLFPLMCLYALAGIPIALFFSLGDLTEEPNNHLVVARKI